MTASLEFKAKNIDKAVEKASEELNVPKEDLKYEVLSYGSSGIFGLSSAKKAKIRVRLPRDSQFLAPKPEISEFQSDPSDVPESPKPSDELNLGDGDAVATEHREGQQLYSFPEDPVDIGRHVLQRIIDAITTDAKISVEQDSERIFFNVNGGNAGILIGKRGRRWMPFRPSLKKLSISTKKTARGFWWILKDTWKSVGKTWKNWPYG